MKLVPFVAETPAAALAQIHRQLGPEAVVVSVRPLPRQGLARFWPSRSAVEVVACVPNPGESFVSQPEVGLAAQSAGMTGTGLNVLGPQTDPGPRFSESLANPGNGLGPLPPLQDESGRPHIFIGPPGTGKTTLLCKWMTWAVLNENRTAKVWRLDGPAANTADYLNVYAEMLGVAVERFWGTPTDQAAHPRPSGEPEQASTDLRLVDLPGIAPGDAEAWNGLKRLFASLPSPRLHLVLNAAYETSILAEQYRAFATFGVEDLSLTHLDEERRQGKLLDFVVGTNCSLRFLSTGQKIPGDLVLAGATNLSEPEFAA